MTSIDEQIKALQLKKKKIEYIKYITDLVKNDTKCIDFKDVKKEVFEKIEPFLSSLSASIETDSAVVGELSKSLDSKEIEALKMVASKVLSKTPIQVSQMGGAPSQESIPKKKPELSNSDKMNFAMNNRHLANKRVQVLNDQNANIFGNVVGLDAPFVLVKTETGPTIQVPLEKVVPQ